MKAVFSARLCTASVALRKWAAKPGRRGSVAADFICGNAVQSFCETSPAPVKYAASLLGKSSPEVRLPLVEASPAARQKVEAAMKAVGLI